MGSKSISELEESLTGTLNTLEKEYATLQEATRIGIQNNTALEKQADIEITKQKIKNEKQLQEIAIERVNRVKKVATQVEEEVYSKILENERLITALQKQRELQSNSVYLSELNYQKQLNKELQTQQKITEKIAAANIDLSKASGKRKANKIAKNVQQTEEHEEIQSAVQKAIGNGNAMSQINGAAGVFSKSIASTFKSGFSYAKKANIWDMKAVDEAEKNGKINYDETRHAVKESKAIDVRLDELKNKAASGKLTKEDIEEKQHLELEKDKLSEVIKNAVDETGLSESALENVIEARDLKNTAAAGIKSMVAGLSTLAKNIDSMVDDIADQKTIIDTRLNGLSSAYTKSDALGNSYWKKISYDFSALMTSPLISEKDLMTNAIAVVNKGIARDVEQTAMLATLKDSIASTFNVYDTTMLRLIKVQDSNTTAVRMGMEVTLNKMLNSMYESTEYLSDIASNVRGSLGEAEALMSDEQAVEFEYQVQKWLGSMYSVGVSDSAVNSIAKALGEIAAGQIEGITGGGAGNLVLMAANQSNLSIADILADGLDASETNTLMYNLVSYMSDLVDEANGNNVVQQQLAKVFGVTASDLKAIKNIINTDTYKSSSLTSIYNYGNASSANGNSIYNNLLGNLYDMANSMYSRTSTGKLLSNVYNNVQYSIASGIASNSVLYMTTKLADLMDSYAGGVEFSLPTVMGTGMSAQTWKVSDILRTASMLGGATSSLISMFGSLASGNGAGWSGQSLLNMVGINSTVKRGASEASSGSGTVTNGSLTDIQSSAQTSTTDSASKTVAGASDTSTEVTNTTINESIQAILTLLTALTDEGPSVLNVSIKNTPTVDIVDTDINTLTSAWTR